MKSEKEIVTVQQVALEVKHPEIDVLRYRMDVLRGAIDDLLLEGQDFGTVPGGGDRKVLLKPGAEKLCTAFSFRPKAEFETKDFDGGHREYLFTIHMQDKNGDYLGFGVGSCSTKESKYRYRNALVDTGKPVPGAYWDLRKTDWKAAQAMLGGSGFTVKKREDGGYSICRKEREENPCIEDTYNTVLKMAKKRALIDAVLTVTAASDVFTQDIEENEGDDNVHVVVDQRQHEQKDHPPQPREDESVRKLRETLDKATTSDQVRKISKSWEEWYSKLSDSALRTMKPVHDAGVRHIDEAIARVMPMPTMEEEATPK